MNALKKKLEANLNERLKLRETEHNKLLQRYQNVKKEIENQQNIERIKFEKQYNVVSKLRPSTASGRSMMGSRMNSSKMKGSQMRHQPASKPSHLWRGTALLWARILFVYGAFLNGLLSSKPMLERERPKLSVNGNNDKVGFQWC